MVLEIHLNDIDLLLNKKMGGGESFVIAKLVLTDGLYL